MNDKINPILIRHLIPKNFLSFGPDCPGIELHSLNLLIGPNGSGKSNLIEAINLMRSAPKEFRDVTRKGGGVSEWIWKGGSKKPASIGWVADYANGSKPIRHAMSFHAVSQAFSLDDECVEESESRHACEQDVFFFIAIRTGNRL